MKRKHKKNFTKYAILIIIVLIMVLSTVGFLWQGTPSSQEEQEIPLEEPSYLKNISISQFTLNDINIAQKIYISISNDTIPQNFNRFTQYLSPKLVLSSFDDDYSINKNIPLKTCDDASDTVKVIILNESQTTEIVYKDNCLILTGDLTKATDKLIFSLLQQ